MPLTGRVGHHQASIIAGGKAIAKLGDIDGADRIGRRQGVWGGTAALMVLPILPQRLASAADRDPGDFLFLAILMIGVGAAHELAIRTTDSRARATALGIALAAALLQAWINLAVGVIGSEDDPANLIYAGVLALPLCGGIMTRLHPLGMARVMVATAIAQVAAFVTMLIAGFGFTGPITVFFSALWLISAGLFRRAAHQA